MKRVLMFAVLGLLFVSAMASANPVKDSATPVEPFQGTLDFRQVDPTPEGGPGTIQYDTGVFTNLPNIPLSTDNFAFGNQFGPIPLPFTVTNMSAFMAIVDGSTTASGNAFVSVFGPVNTAGTAASVLTSVSRPFVANTFAANTLPAQAFTGTGSSSFLVGVWNFQSGSTTTAVPCAVECVGFDNNDGGQGFNGMAIRDVNGLDFTPITTANAILRVSGPNVPVELMSFSIED